MPDHPKRSQNQQLYFLTFLHTVIDSYATLLPHLLPVLLTRLAAQTTAKYSLAGALISVYNFFSALNQIFFGWLEDRVRSIHFLTFGVACTAFCLSLLNAAPSIGAVFLLLIAGGTGVAAFHPLGTVQAASLAKQGRGLGVSIFLTGGNLGRAAGPFFIMLFLVRYGWNRLVWCMIPGLLLASLVPKVLELRHPKTPSPEMDCPSLQSKKQSALWDSMRPCFRPLFALYLIAVLRTLTTIGLENFLSLFLDERGYSNVARSAVLALFLLAGTVGIVVGGSLSHRIARHRMLLFSLIASPPLLYLSLHSSSTVFLLLLFLGNVTLSASTSVNIVWAQQLLLERENMASSLMMGGAWGVGGVLSIPVGMLGDRFGLVNVLDCLTVLPLVAAPLVVFLRNGSLGSRHGDEYSEG